MAGNLYIASLEPYSGKLVITLGVMEMLSRCIDRLGFFRVIVAGEPDKDSHIRLLASRFNLALEPGACTGSVTNRPVP